jgi:hypothetical protein
MQAGALPAGPPCAAIPHRRQRDAHMKFSILAVALAAALAPALSQAQDAAAPSSVTVRPVLGLMGTFGGDKIAHVVFTDGTTNSATAGGTAYLYAGAAVRPTALPLSVLATVGYHVSSAGGENGDFRFERIPLELLAMVDVIPSRLRLGGGFRYDSGVNLSAHGVVAAPATKFKDSSGGVVQAEWMLGSQFSITARYVAIRYRFEDGTGASTRIDGSHGGIGVNWYL